MQDRGNMKILKELTGKRMLLYLLILALIKLRVMEADIDFVEDIGEFVSTSFCDGFLLR